MPALSHFYPGITPPVIDQMTLREVSEYLSQMDDYLYLQAEREAVRADGG